MLISKETNIVEIARDDGVKVSIGAASMLNAAKDQRSLESLKPPR